VTTVSNPILADLFRHNLWANLVLIDCCQSVPPQVVETSVPGTYGTIVDTLKHIAGAEERYLAGLTGGPERRNPTLEETNPDLATIRAHLRDSGEGLIAFAEDVDGDPTLEVTWRGEVYQAPASLFLVQAVNHATEHRSQIMTALTQAGVEPPELDGWTWDEQRRGVRE
jgi:uncharacterized damage-inducible protein DinB